MWSKKKMARRSMAIVLFVLPIFVTAQQPAVVRAGSKVSLYKASYAIVIGASAYQTWSALPNVAKESRLVVDALTRSGFSVRYVLNPTGENLRSSLSDFFSDYGNDPDNRLLVFYAGHGHSVDDVGYLVGVDAPDPNVNGSLFRRRSQSMSMLVHESKEYRARHILYVFDSCFSGAIFSTRSASDLPSGMDNISRYLTGPASHPVRQFITAGNEKQRVPEISQFTPLFIRAIDGQISELNKNGFVSGKELGLWLSKNLATYQSNQTPKSGTILDSRFDGGDFVFGLPSPSLVYPPSAQQQLSAPRKSASCFVFNEEKFCE